MFCVPRLRVTVQWKILIFTLIMTLAVVPWWMVAGVLAMVALTISMATAGLLTTRCTSWLGCWIGLAVWSAWLGLWVAAQTVWLPTAFMVMASWTIYRSLCWLVVKDAGTPRSLAHGPHPPPQP
jgi:hypothetical protein